MTNASDGRAHDPHSSEYTRSLQSFSACAGVQHAPACGRDEGEAGPGRELSKLALAEMSIIPAFRSDHPGPYPHVDPHVDPHLAQVKCALSSATVSLYHASFRDTGGHSSLNPG